MGRPRVAIESILRRAELPSSASAISGQELEVVAHTPGIKPSSSPFPRLSATNLNSISLQPFLGLAGRLWRGSVFLCWIGVHFFPLVVKKFSSFFHYSWGLSQQLQRRRIFLAGSGAWGGFSRFFQRFSG